MFGFFYVIFIWEFVLWKGETEKVKYNETPAVENGTNLIHVDWYFEETFQLLLLLTKHDYYNDQPFSCKHATKAL